MRLKFQKLEKSSQAKKASTNDCHDKSEEISNKVLSVKLDRILKCVEKERIIDVAEKEVEKKETKRF